MFVEVLLDQNLSTPLDYTVPAEFQKGLEIGMRVEVPLRKGIAQGTVVKIKSHSEWSSVKSIVRFLSAKGELSDPLWKLAHWMSRYYCTPLQRVLKCFIPVNVRKETNQKTNTFLEIAKTHKETIQACQELRIKAPAQAHVLDLLLAASKGLFLKDLDVSRAAVDALVKKKWIKIQQIVQEEDLLADEEFFPTKPKRLNGEQKKTTDAIVESLRQNTFSTHLIYGVTGSGKTEVYMQAIQAALDQNKSAIMLVPEISLTSQTIERFRARFAQKIAILHHRRSLGERNSAWESLRSGEAKIAIGARSAIFCPAQNLGLIIVDEEHDSSYKQTEESPSYHGRDVAVMRGHLENCVVLLGSATPSIESRYNAECGKYQLHLLTTRATTAVLPKVQIVDMKQALDQVGGFSHFSPQLLDALRKRLDEGEQSLLFLNKRGYHRMQTCAACRHTLKCPHCDLSLTFHKEDNHLRCHLCGFSQTPPRHCPECNASESLQFKGFGTEHVERSLHAIFPEIRTLRMDRDTTSRKNSHEELFKQFRAHKADVLIGTQMIAKGFHFPSVTLVGVLNTDATLSIPDFRSPEQVFQLLTQVAGRAGRDQLPGEVIIQTFLPDHPTIQLAAAQDYSTFYTTELLERKTFSYPPFCHLIKLLFTDTDQEAAQVKAAQAHTLLQQTLPPDTELLPVVTAGHPKIKDLYRFQCLIKCKKIGPIVDLLKKLSLQAKIDIDPLSTFF